MKNLLIVDDELEITNSLSEYFLEKGFSVSACGAVDEALDLYMKKKPDLILSDIKMPGKSGIDFYKQCQVNETATNKVPFVLMTGYADIIGVEKAFDMGVSELIAKPFDLDSINLVINYLLELDDSVGRGQKYFPVLIQDFMLSKVSDFSIYLKIGEKYVLVTKTGQEFTEQRVVHFAKKGVSHIYLNAEDFAKYTDVQFMIANSVSQRPIDLTRKNKLMNYLTQSVSQQIIFNEVDQQLFNNSRTAFEAYAALALNNTQINTLFSHLLLSTPNVVQKSANRTIICSMVLSSWKWNSPKIQSRMIMSALFCDIGLKNFPEICKKNRTDYTADDNKLYEKHPMESYKILSQIYNMPDEVLIVALQHHENSSGLGFPHKLNRDKLHAFSKIVHCVDEFIEALYSQPESDRSVQKALDYLFQTQSKMISDQVLKSLYIIFKVQLPKAYESLLLPDQTARVI